MTPTTTPYREEAERLAKLVRGLRACEDTAERARATAQYHENSAGERRREIARLLARLGEDQVLVGELLISRTLDADGIETVTVTEPLVLS